MLRHSSNLLAHGGERLSQAAPFMTRIKQGIMMTALVLVSMTIISESALAAIRTCTLQDGGHPSGEVFSLNGNGNFDLVSGSITQDTTAGTLAFSGTLRHQTNGSTYSMAFTLSGAQWTSFYTNGFLQQGWSYSGWTGYAGTFSSLSWRGKNATFLWGGGLDPYAGGQAGIEGWFNYYLNGQYYTDGDIAFKANCGTLPSPTPVPTATPTPVPTATPTPVPTPTPTPSPSTVSIGDRVWLDSNKNGRQDVGEPGLGNAQVQLIGPLGPTGHYRTTDSNGYYLFSGYIPERYAVEFTIPSLMTASPANVGDEIGDSDGEISIGGNRLRTQHRYVAGGTSDPHFDQGLYNTTTPTPTPTPTTTPTPTPTPVPGEDAQVGDYVWIDDNMNGIQDAGELPYTGNDIRLEVRAWHSGLGGWTGISNKLVNANGIYKILVGTGVLADYSRFRVQFLNSDLPAGYVVSSANQSNATCSGAGNCDQVDSDFHPPDANSPHHWYTDEFGLVDGQKDFTWDLGIYREGQPTPTPTPTPTPQPETAKIGNKVWYDLDEDGIQDGSTNGEDGVPNVTVYLKNAGGAILDTTTTNANGVYKFINLQPGDYRIGFDLATLPTGYRPTLKDQGTQEGKDSDADAASGGMTEVTTLTAGEQDFRWDLGIVPIGYDLALTKKLAVTQSASVRPGEDVTFTLTVINQGTVDATDVTVTDYVPAGMTFMAGDNPAWGTDGSGNQTRILAGPIAANGGTASVDLVLHVNSNAVAGTLENAAEISRVTPGETDVDSTPDADPTNDGPVTDDAVNNENGDEDDHDIAQIMVAEVFDLALRKTLGPGQTRNLQIGDSVRWDIEVFNQGTVPAKEITVRDWVPRGFDSVDPSWTYVGVRVDGRKYYDRTIRVASPLNPGDSERISFVVKVVAPTAVINVNIAEIFAAVDDTTGLSGVDVDSTRDNNPINDSWVNDVIDNSGGDEDDHDLDPVIVNLK